MRAIRRKLASDRGASITFALLIFLVCAIISSVVIVAGTAASGRISQLAQMDQRYYAVNSAAELVRDLLEGQEVTVITTETTKYTKSVVNGVTTTGSPEQVPEESGVAFTVQPDFSNPDDDSDDGEGSLLVKVAKAMADKSDPALSPVTLSFTPASDDLDTSGLDVILTPLWDPTNYTLNIGIANADGKPGDVYALNVTFRADVMETSGSITAYGNPEPGTGVGDYTQEIKTTSTTTTTVRLKMIGLKTIVAARPTNTPEVSP